MARHEWWDKFGMDGFMEIFALHKKDLAEVYGAFKDYPSFRSIIDLEYQRWKFTDEAQASYALLFFFHADQHFWGGVFCFV
jgi:hypothetical protein